jgi:hypothetical protein
MYSEDIDADFMSVVSSMYANGQRSRSMNRTVHWGSVHRSSLNWNFENTDWPASCQSQTVLDP